MRSSNKHREFNIGKCIFSDVLKTMTEENLTTLLFRDMTVYFNACYHIALKKFPRRVNLLHDILFSRFARIPFSRVTLFHARFVSRQYILRVNKSV